jgi:RND family efflux transporter MFP subunit
MRKLLVIILSSILLLSACGPQEEDPKETIESTQEAKLKVVEVFDLSRASIELPLSKNGTAESFFITQVTPQIAGRVLEIHAQVGESVEKGQSLITLGESLNTSLLELQEATADVSTEIAAESNATTKIGAEVSQQSAVINSDTAYLNYQNALTNKDTTAKTLTLQRQQAEISLYEAEKNYREVYDQYRNAKGKTPRSYNRNHNFKLDQLESSFENSGSTSTTETTSNTTTDLDQTLKAAEKQLQQAELTLLQTDSTQATQTSQLNYAIEVAKQQYELSLVQQDATAIQGELQILASESQLVQAQSGLESAKLSQNEKVLRAPITGKITQIIAEEGNLVSPGQTLLKIENDNLLSVTTSLNPEEARLISSNKVLVQYNNSAVEGNIISISPTLNAQSKKADVEIEVAKTAQIPTGAFVKVHFPITNVRTTFVPLNSIFLDDNVKKVRLLTADNKIKHQDIEIGEILGHFAEVTSGLEGDEVIVTNADLFLKEGEKVLVKVPNESK